MSTSVAHQGASCSAVVQVSCCLLAKMKGKTQLPQLPDDGDEDAEGDGDVVVGGDVHSEYLVML